MEQMKKQSVDIAVLSEQEAGMVALRTAYDNVKARLAEKEKELGVQRARAVSNLIGSGYLALCTQ